MLLERFTQITKVLLKILVSARTFTQQTEKSSENVKETSKTQFSIALDGSTDVKDTAQFGIFLRGINLKLLSQRN